MEEKLQIMDRTGGLGFLEGSEKQNEVVAMPSVLRQRPQRKERMRVLINLILPLLYIFIYTMLQ